MGDFTIEDMLAIQQALQEKYKDKWEPIGPEAGKHKLLWMLGEVGEVIDIIKKNGDQKAVEDAEVRQHFVEEMADVLMYYNDVLLCYGISEQELKEAYTAKFKKNMTRWKFSFITLFRSRGGLLSKSPIFRTKGAKSWPVLPLRRRDFWIILLTCILFCIFLFSRAKGGILTNYLFQFARILAFCFLGEICHAVLPLPIPASIYGLLLLLAALRFGIVKLEQVKEVGLFLTGIFPLLFVPAAAGVMELWAEMGEMLLPIVIAIIPVTVLVLVSAGRTTQALTSRRAARKEAEHD